MNDNKVNDNSILQDLYEVFYSEFKWYEVMLDLVKKEREAVVTDNIEELIEITKKQEELIPKLKSLEEERETLISRSRETAPSFLTSDAWQSQINSSYDKLSLKDIIELTEEPYSSKFEELRKKMKELLSEIRKMNERNCQLLKRIINTFNATIELLLSESNSAQTYSRSGKLSQSEPYNSFLKGLG